MTSASRSQCLQGAIHGVWSERGIDLVWPDSTYRMAFRRRNFGKYWVWDERKYVLCLQLGDYWFHGVAKRLSRLGIYTWHSAVLASWNLYVAFSCSCIPSAMMLSRHVSWRTTTRIFPPDHVLSNQDQYISVNLKNHQMPSHNYWPVITRQDIIKGHVICPLWIFDTWDFAKCNPEMERAGANK